MQEFPKTFSPKSATKLRIATFDTRMKMKLAQRFGFAAMRMALQLREQGHGLISEPARVIINGQKGPVAEEELERAAQWGKELSSLAFSRAGG
jgi:hypothetical protein